MNHRIRMWIEAVLAGFAGVLTVVTLLWPTWIESVLGESPDGGDGSAERALALIWVVIAVAFSLMARRDWRRLVSAPKTGAQS